jgi:xylulokinase
MSQEAVIGVDIGTQRAKAAVFTRDGTCLANAFRESRLLRPAPGTVEEDPEHQFATVCQTIRECVRTARLGAGSVAGIGIDGQMAGVIGIGADGRNVTPYDSWLDTRCRPYIELMNQRAGEEVLQKTGCTPSFNHGPKILWWMNERKAAFRKVRTFVQPGGYAAMRLCGLSARDAFIDTTYLHFSGFADNQGNRWDSGLCKTFSLDEAKLPRMAQPHEIVGELCASAARRCGLRKGVPVVAGCGDTAASFLACGATEPGTCIDVAGTACVFAATTDAFRPDVQYRTLGCGQSATPGLWHPYAYINGGGMNLEWFCREIANRGKTAESGAGGKKEGILSLAELDEMAAAIGVEESVPLFIPHLAGRVCPSEPGIRGAWAGLDWSHGMGHLYRAVLEGVALEYGIYRNALLRLYPKLTMREIRITGGGEKSRIWNRIKASVFQTPVVQIARSHGAPAGSALLAGYGVGIFRSLPEAAGRWIALGKRVEPEEDMVRHYRAKLPLFEKLLEAVGRVGVV